MITIGLAKELYFMAHILKQNVEALVVIGAGNAIKLNLTVDGMLDVFFRKEDTWYHIWHEKVEGDDSFFGIESCDAISRITACIESGTPWQHLVYHEKP